MPFDCSRSYSLRFYYFYFVKNDVCRAAVRIRLFILKSPGATGAL